MRETKADLEARVTRLRELAESESRQSLDLRGQVRALERERVERSDHLETAKKKLGQIRQTLTAALIVVHAVQPAEQRAWDDKLDTSEMSPEVRLLNYLIELCD